MIVYLFVGAWIAAVVPLTIAFPLEAISLYGALLVGHLVRDSASAS